MMDLTEKCPECGTSLVIGTDWGKVLESGEMPEVISMAKRCPNEDCEIGKVGR